MASDEQMDGCRREDGLYMANDEQMDGCRREDDRRRLASQAGS
jgi:hypothetical protein